jgi:HD-GYP domain-containing protein (c-di-GMP phosphodiesterase class II)
VLATHDHLGSALPDPAAPPRPERFLGPLKGLDLFLQELQHADDGANHLRILLKAIGETTRAEAVFIQSAVGERPFESAGSHPLTPEDCQRWLRRLAPLAAGAESRLFQAPELARLLADAAPAPHSLAMVQLSKSRDTWAVAVRMTAGRPFDAADLQAMVLARRLLAAQSRQLRAAEKLRDALLGLVHCLTAAIDAKDPYTCGHSERVARMAVRISQEMRCPPALVSDIYLAGLLHDIGKIGIKDSVLLKPGKLTDEETRIIQQHPVIGDRIIATVSQLQHVRPGVRSHHERFDGRGYPDQLAGEQIPLLARILAVADSCDAMSSARPYRPPMPAARIEAIVMEGAGGQWDAQVVSAFLRCRQECDGICQRGIGQSVAMAVDHAMQIQSDTSWKQSITSNLFKNEAPPTRVPG